MSHLTRWIKKPVSWGTDAMISVGIGGLVGALFQLAIGELLPFDLGDNIAFGIGGLTTGVLFVRARRNLESEPPAWDSDE